MGRNRFAGPSIPHRISLSDGDWIEVRKFLNNGEAKRLEAAGLMSPIRTAPTETNPQGEILTPIDMERYELERAAVYLLDWSFRNEADKSIPLNGRDGSVDLGALRALTPEDFEEMNRAIVAHIIVMAKEKKAQREAAAKTAKEAALPESVPALQ